MIDVFTETVCVVPTGKKPKRAKNKQSFPAFTAAEFIAANNHGSIHDKKGCYTNRSRTEHFFNTSNSDGMQKKL